MLLNNTLIRFCVKKKRTFFSESTADQCHFVAPNSTVIISDSVLNRVNLSKSIQSESTYSNPG